MSLKHFHDLVLHLFIFCHFCSTDKEMSRVTSQSSIKHTVYQQVCKKKKDQRSNDAKQPFYNITIFHLSAFLLFFFSTFLAQILTVSIILTHFTCSVFEKYFASFKSTFKCGNSFQVHYLYWPH